MNLWIPKKLEDPDAVKHALVQSLGFPLQFDGEEYNPYASYEDAEESKLAPWFLSSGHSDKAFPGEGLKSHGRIDFSPLVAALRPLDVELLVVGIMFDRQSPNLTLTGAKQVGPPSLNNYQTQFNVFGDGNLRSNSRGDMLELMCCGN